MLKEQNNIYSEDGVYISIDFEIKLLKIYYSERNYSNAYTELRLYLQKHGFAHIKDSNYVSKTLSMIDAHILIDIFAEENKWFPICQTKIHILPLAATWDLTEHIKAYRTDEKFKLQKEEEALSKGISIPQDHKRLSEQIKTAESTLQNNSSTPISPNISKERDI